MHDPVRLADAIDDADPSLDQVVVALDHLEPDQAIERLLERQHGGWKLVRYRFPSSGGRSLPGFMIPAGSSLCFAALIRSIPSSPTSRSSQPAWSRPTAWWWVIVPPLEMIASHAADFAARHCSSSAPRSCAAMNVKYSEAPLG